jgi:hypothetical protein
VFQLNTPPQGGVFLNFKSYCYDIYIVALRFYTSLLDSLLGYAHIWKDQMIA